MKVNVYLSYYNGSKYLEEQINSLLNQKGVDVRIFIRDDGSCEKESEYLDRFLCDSRIKIFHEKNVGFGKSFMRLVVVVNEKADYYAFCDQDDVWLECKLQIACEKLRQISGPAAYCALPKYVNSKLETLNGFGTMTDEIHFGKMGVEDALAYQLFGIGCTYVWNDRLNEILQKINLESFSFAHDNFLSVLTPFVGTFYRDCSQSILYRQHEKNVSGNKKKNKPLLEKFQRKWKNFNGQTSYRLRKYVAGVAETFASAEKLKWLKMSSDYREHFVVKLKLIHFFLLSHVNLKKRMKIILMILGNRY